jgi:glycosyltransferase involved in cell wall biosynthesis
MHKVAIVHPYLRCAGGSEARALWAVQALQYDYHVTMITMGKTNLIDLNKYYGTNLSLKSFQAIEIPFPPILGKYFYALRIYPLARYCRKQANRYDLMISTYNFMDFGKKGIQFLADFSFDDELRKALHPSLQYQKRGFFQNKIIKKPYLNLARLLTGDHWTRILTNLTIANSHWSQKVLLDKYGIQSNIIYPPVNEVFLDIPWNQRENGFIALGRISPEKRFEYVIHILSQIRKMGHDIHLHIVGSIEDSKNKVYIESIKDLSNQHKNWVFLEGILSGKDKYDMISKHKFGFSACKNEAFGIAVAEMIKGGCIVFVPDGGGQIEIINHDELIYDEADILMKLNAVLSNKAKQEILREHLKIQAKFFCSDKFMSDIKALVKDFLSVLPK